MPALFTKLNSRGDTIVEVMIAVAIVSSVLVGAFIVTQKSTLAVRNSQEHAEMAQILQGQVELVRGLTLTENSAETGVYKTSPKYFCIDDSNSAHPKRVDSEGLGNQLQLVDGANDANEFEKYNPACRNKQGLYNVAISYDPSSKVFTFTGRWDRLGGSKNQEVLAYRISPGSLAQITPAPSPGPAPVPGPSPAPTPPSSNGDAIIQASICAVDPANKICDEFVPGGSYVWTDYFTNYSTNPSSKISGCTWSFGDGKTDNTHCIGAGVNGLSEDDATIEHDFPRPSQAFIDAHPYPKLCGADIPGGVDPVVYTIVLTIKFKDGSPDQKDTQTTTMPQCI